MQLPPPKTGSLTAMPDVKVPISAYAGWSKAQLEQELEELRHRLSRLNNQKATMFGLRDWLMQPPVLEKVEGTAWQQLLEAEKARLLLASDNHPSPIADRDSMHVFLVQHNWANAFSNAGDFTEGPYRLPFPHCCFEFQISNRRICVLATQNNDEDPAFYLYFGFKGWWFQWGPLERDGDGHGSFIHDQVRAVCIALDAEVALAEPVRASAALNRARIERGRPLLPDHSLVSLCRRVNTLRSHGDGEGPSTRRRLHFRRGHWRHYDAYKRWIRWMLVGDPDLGFIEQKYRL